MDSRVEVRADLVAEAEKLRREFLHLREKHFLMKEEFSVDRANYLAVMADFKTQLSLSCEQFAILREQAWRWQ